MILRFSSQPDSPHNQIFRKADQKKTKPNRPFVFGPRAPDWREWGLMRSGEKQAKEEDRNRKENVSLL
jgi:hypothetical protein